mmetsp:Transcript_18766/g.43118  ORF Transcript_18766/g.43118 Transcript_18766/m.43118 type:complete len:286 (-) Transcript_18766:1317-2174(-)
MPESRRSRLNKIATRGGDANVQPPVGVSNEGEEGDILLERADTPRLEREACNPFLHNSKRSEIQSAEADLIGDIPPTLLLLLRRFSVDLLLIFLSNPLLFLFLFFSVLLCLDLPLLLRFLDDLHSLLRARLVLFFPPLPYRIPYNDLNPHIRDSVLCPLALVMIPARDENVERVDDNAGGREEERDADCRKPFDLSGVRINRRIWHLLRFPASSLHLLSHRPRPDLLRLPRQVQTLYHDNSSDYCVLDLLHPVLLPPLPTLLQLSLRGISQPVQVSLRSELGFRR